MDQKAHNTTTSRPLSRASDKYWHLLICIPVDLEWVYQSIASKRSDKQWLRFQEGGGNPPSTLPPPPLARYVSRNGLTVGGLDHFFLSCCQYVKAFPDSIHIKTSNGQKYLSKLHLIEDEMQFWGIKRLLILLFWSTESHLSGFEMVSEQIINPLLWVANLFSWVLHIRWSWNQVKFVCCFCTLQKLCAVRYWDRNPWKILRSIIKPETLWLLILLLIYGASNKVTCSSLGCPVLPYPRVY